MPANEDVVKSCEKCGATIYPEHLEQHKADLVGGRLLCPFCIQEEKVADPTVVAAVAATPEPAAEPIQLVDVLDAAAGASAGDLKQYGGGGITFDQTADGDEGYRRPVNPDTRTATRCRTFHGKLNDASMNHLNRQINEWVDANDDIQIKFVTSDIGIVEGKHADQHLILTVFY
ncbi:MAG: hypothetical protein JXO22_01020 [Phycisphaerae bacterium]|nr:hypothetical protein [Phycisphaerae bacterium]